MAPEGSFFCVTIFQMPLYDADNRLTSDACARGMRDADNRNIMSYYLACLRSSEGPSRMATSCRNLRSWDGFGINPCSVDDDTRLRLDSEVTHPRSRIQLAQRVFQAAPDLSHGQPSFVLESELLQGNQNTRKIVTTNDSCCMEDPMTYGMNGMAYRCCGDINVAVDRLAEHTWDVMHPTLKQVDVKHIVPPWTNGGAPSREIARSPEFLQKLGYKQ